MTTPQRAALTARMNRKLSGLGANWQPVASTWVWGGAGGGLGATTGAEPGDAAAARRAFVDWLARAYPGVVEELAAALENGNGAAGLGANGNGDDQSWVDKIAGAAEQILPAYLQYQQQQDVLEFQLERARAGMPPLETGQYAPSVQVGLDEETVRRLGDEAMTRAGTTLGPAVPWLLIGGTALALFAFSGRGRRRRRRK